jgi:hypothetical protein
MAKKNKSKLPDYTLRAIANYQEKHDKIIFIGPLGLKDRIKKIVQDSEKYNSLSAFCVDAIIEKLEALEENKTDL